MCCVFFFFKQKAGNEFSAGLWGSEMCIRARRHIDRDRLEAASLEGATGWTMAWHMELPLAAPAILGGLRNGFALSVTGAVVGEMVMGGTGLGQVLTQMRNNVDTAGMFVIIIILCTMATLLYTIVYRIERSKRYDITQ